ncbi:transcription factor [Rhodotorula toruloides]|uniref:Transcription factor n=1 Tax=Rhodotorula toruloides TaxID=5286 RepID=A0A511KK57_RHOTO|nr:transcription factor [Rhodotorula toruloides]
MPLAITPPAAPRKAHKARTSRQTASQKAELAWAPPRPRRTASSPERAKEPLTPSRRSTRSTDKRDSPPAAPSVASSFSTKQTRDEPLTPPATPKKPQRAGFSAIIAKLSHPTGKVNPDYQPKRSDNKSCDPCNKRREKCDHYTVCGSCIVHGTVCTWHRATPLYEREAFASCEHDRTLDKLENEAQTLREKITDLASRAGLDAKHLLKPEVLSTILAEGLPPSPPISPARSETDQELKNEPENAPESVAPKKRTLTVKLALMRFLSQTAVPLPPPPPSPPLLDYVPQVHAPTLPSFPDKPLPSLAGLAAGDASPSAPAPSKPASQPLYALFDQLNANMNRGHAFAPPRRPASPLSPTAYFAFIRSPNPSPPPPAALPALLSSALPALPSPTFAHSSPPKFRPRGLQATLSPEVELKSWWTNCTYAVDASFDAGASWMTMHGEEAFVVKAEEVEDEMFMSSTEGCNSKGGLR